MTEVDRRCLSMTAPWERVILFGGKRIEIGIECRGFGFSAQGILPSKTLMNFRGTEIEVKEGYGAGFDILK